MSRDILEEYSKRIDLAHEKRIKHIEKLMEEMAGAPREEMGKRQPGEKNAYERYNMDLYNERVATYLPS